MLLLWDERSPGDGAAQIVCAATFESDMISDRRSSKGTNSATTGARSEFWLRVPIALLLSNLMSQGQSIVELRMVMDRSVISLWWPDSERNTLCLRSS